MLVCFCVDWVSLVSFCDRMGVPFTTEVEWILFSLGLFMNPFNRTISYGSSSPEKGTLDSLVIKTAGVRFTDAFVTVRG